MCEDDIRNCVKIETVELGVPLDSESMSCILTLMSECDAGVVIRLLYSKEQTKEGTTKQINRCVMSTCTYRASLVTIQTMNSQHNEW